jgi:hypothetical protein
MVNGMILYPTDDECMVLNLLIFSAQWEKVREEAKSIMLSEGTKHLVDLIWQTGWYAMILCYLAVWNYKPLKINELVLG